MSDTVIKIMPLLPVMILGITLLIVMAMIAVRRCYKSTVFASAFGVLVAFGSSVLLAMGVFDQAVMTTGATVGQLFFVDGFALINTAVILLASLACVLLSYPYFARLKSQKEELYLLLLASTMGAVLMVSSSHLSSFFMSLELLSVPMVGMLAYHFLKAKSLESGLKYLVLSAVASATLLMGMAFIYAGTGVLGFTQIGYALLSGQVMGHLVVLGATMMVCAIGFKLSLAPFHAWAGDVYEGSPAPVTAFLASVSKVAAVGLGLRFLATSSLPAITAIDTVMTWMVVLSILAGNLLALYQTSIKRLLAYSSIAHMGYVVIAFLSLGAMADNVITMYMLIYTLTSLGAFGVLILLTNGLSKQADDIGIYRGLFWRRPVLTVVMTAMLLSLAGIPLTAGFMTKIQVMLAAVQGGRFGLAVMLVVGSAIGLYYYLRVVLMMYKRPLEQVRFDVANNWKARLSGAVVMVSALLIVVWGVLPKSLFDLADLARMMQ